MKNNKNVLFLILSISLLFGLFIWNFTTQVMNQTRRQTIHDNIVSDSSEKEEIDVNSSMVSLLLEKIKYTNNCKVYYPYLQSKDVTTNNLSNEVIYLLALDSFLNEVYEISDSPTGVYYDFSSSRLEKAIQDIVGSNYSFKNQTYSICPTWQFDSSTSTYKAPSFSNCTCSYQKYRDIVKTIQAERVDDEVYIYQRVIFVDQNGNGYKDYQRTILLENLKRVVKNKVEVIEEISSNYSQGSLYKITFVKDKDNYIFLSSELLEE